MEHDTSMIKMVEQSTIDSAQGVDKIEQVVNAWISEHIHNSPASQDTVVYNHIMAGVGKLVSKIKEVI